MLPILFIRNNEQSTGRPSRAIKATILFCFAALLAASPLLIRNAVWTGNPLYPLYNSVFSRINPTNFLSTNTIENKTEQQAPPADLKKEQDRPVRGVFARRYILYGENIWQLLLLPVRIFIEGQDGDPRYFDGRLNPFLLVLTLLAFIGSTQPRIRNEKVALAAFSVFYFLYAFNTGVLRIRYLVPMVPCLVILSMYGLNNLEKLSQKYIHKKAAQLVWPLVLFCLLTWNGSYIVKLYKEIEPLSYITGQVERDEYLSKRLPEYPIMQYANKNLPESSKILCLFLGWRGYYLNRPHLFDSQGNSSLLLSWLQQPAANLATLQKKLQQNKITHLFIRTDLMLQWLRSATPHQQKLWNQLITKHLVAEHRNLNYILYKMKFSD
jgi:hypothetical protein